MIFTVKYAVEAKIKPIKWNIIEIEEIKTHRIELEDFEVVTQPDKYTKWKIEEFEELLDFKDKHEKATKHIKILAYGRNKKGDLIAITLLKDLKKNPPSLTIYTYNIDKELWDFRNQRYLTRNLTTKEGGKHG
jgi:hypothetical protein